MEITTILLVVLILAVGYLVLLLKKQQDNKPDDTGFKLLQQQLFELNKQLDSKLTETNRSLNDQLSKSNQTLQQQFAVSQRNLQDMSKVSTDIIKSVTEKLTKVEETNSQIRGFAGQLQSLENILKNPKQRGILGEYFLENVLKNVLPPKSYQMQFRFNNGEAVDAAIFVRDKIIPIDAKFSLENYNKVLQATTDEDRDRLQKVFKQDLKNRIDETSKYIRPNEKTMSFAFMFIPAEGIYYDLLINQIGVVKTNTQDLIEYAFKEKGVIIVSPTSFLAYLQTVLQGLRSLEIEEQAQQIKINVEKLQRHLNSYESNMLKLGKNLGTVVNAYNDAQSEYVKVDKDILQITGNAESIVSEKLLVTKPAEQLN